MSTRIAVFDFDGTLTTASWPRHSRHDEPENASVLALAHALSSAGVGIVILSGRGETSRRVVEQWLNVRGVEPMAVILRQSWQPDDGPSVVAQYKAGHLESLGRDHHVLFFAEDQPDAREAASRLGIPTLDPATLSDGGER